MTTIEKTRARKSTEFLRIKNNPSCERNVLPELSFTVKGIKSPIIAPERKEPL